MSPPSPPLLPSLSLSLPRLLEQASRLSICALDLIKELGH